MKKFLTAAVALTLMTATTTLASNQVTTEQVRVAANNFLGTEFRTGFDTDTTRLTPFVAGSYAVTLDNQHGGIGTGQTRITATFSNTALTAINIHSHLHTHENNPPANVSINNDTLTERAVAAGGANFEPVVGATITGQNFALAVDWAVRMAAQPYQFVYANRGHVPADNQVALTNGVHLMTVETANSPLTVALGVSAGNIDTAAIIHRGVDGIADVSAQALANQIVANQSLVIDTISGATQTSQVVQNALTQMANNNHTRVNAPNVAQLTREYITASQNAWRNAIMAMSEAYREGGDFVMIAEGTLNNLYAFNYGVLFAPSQSSFRNDWDSMMTFLVGDYANTGNQSREGDGFALQTHRYIRFEAGTFTTSGTQAFWNGYVHFYDNFGTPTVVAKSFGYMIGSDGAIRINLQHSHVVSIGERSTVVI